MGNATIHPIRPGVNSGERFADRTAPLLLALMRAAKGQPAAAVDAIANALEEQVDTPHDDFDKKFAAVLNDNMSPEDRVYAIWMFHIAVFFRRGKFQNIWFGPDMSADIFSETNVDRLRVGEAVSPAEYDDLCRDLALLARIEPGAMVHAEHESGSPSFLVTFPE